MSGLTLVVAAYMPFMLACASSQPTEPRPSAWPVVVESVTEFHLEDRRQPEARLLIDGTNGRPLYLLECYLNAYEERQTGRRETECGSRQPISRAYC